MTTSKFKIILHTSTGALGCLLLLLVAILCCFTHEYILGGAVAVMAISIIYRVIKDHSRWPPRYGGYYLVIFSALWLGYQEYNLYKRELWQGKYGLLYNTTRERLGVPKIPPDWKPEYNFDGSVDWKGKEGVMGHETKQIYFDSVHKVKYERDDYNLKTVDGSFRNMSVLFKYAQGKGKDSMFYWYQGEYSTRKISRQQADSLFDVDKIRKDY